MSNLATLSVFEKKPRIYNEPFIDIVEPKSQKIIESSWKCFLPLWIKRVISQFIPGLSLEVIFITCSFLAAYQVHGNRHGTLQLCNKWPKQLEQNQDSHQVSLGLADMITWQHPPTGN